MALEKHHHHHHHHSKDNGKKNIVMTNKSNKEGDEMSLGNVVAASFPFEALGALWDGPMSLFSGFCTPGSRVDWKGTADKHIFKADLPGLTKEDVKVTVQDGNMLQVLGHRRPDSDDAGGHWHRLERHNNNTFMRRFQLPSDALVDTMKIKVENGVLTIHVPKDKHHKAPPRISKEIPVQWDQ